jgi:hypothetical protein
MIAHDRTIFLKHNAVPQQDLKQGVKQGLEQDAFRAGERRINAKIMLAEQGIGASLARLRRELAVIRWMLAGVFAAVTLVPLVMPFVA